ncbi:MAG: cupredoxin domain-containing protein [Dehalococcoidia bacterium]
MTGNFHILLLASLTGLAALAASGCGTPDASTPAPTPPVAESHEIGITAAYPEFEPSSITITRGQAFQLSLSSMDPSHIFRIDELGIDIVVGGGETVTREIKVDRVGTFTFFCAVPGHREAGMEGTLNVVEG